MTADQHLERVARARRSQQDAQGEWVEAVLEAHRAGLSYRRIAQAAGLLGGVLALEPGLKQVRDARVRLRRARRRRRRGSQVRVFKIVHSLVYQTECMKRARFRLPTRRCGRFRPRVAGAFGDRLRGAGRRPTLAQRGEFHRLPARGPLAQLVRAEDS